MNKDLLTISIILIGQGRGSPATHDARHRIREDSQQQEIRASGLNPLAAEFLPTGHNPNSNGFLVSNSSTNFIYVLYF